MDAILLGALAIILLAVIEQLVAWILDKYVSPGSVWRHPVSLVVAVIVLAVIAVSLQTRIAIPSVTATPKAGLLYQLTVQDGVSEVGIEGATVILTVPGVSPFRATTDVSGLAVIEGIPDDVSGKTAVLTINADNYAPYRLNVAVNLNQLPNLIALEER